MTGPRRETLLPARFAPLAAETAGVSTPAAATTLGFGASFVHVQRTTLELGAVQAGDGLVGFLGVAHFDKRKAAGAARIAIRHQVDPINRSIPLKHGTYGGVCSGKIQIANENILHVFILFCLSIARQRRGRSGQPGSGGTFKRHLKYSMN